MSALAFNIILAALVLAGGVALAFWADCNPRQKYLKDRAEWHGRISDA